MLSMHATLNCNFSYNVVCKMIPHVYCVGSIYVVPPPYTLVFKHMCLLSYLNQRGAYFAMINSIETITQWVLKGAY